MFQRQRVDMLLTELAQKFPPKSFPAAHQVQPVTATATATDKTGSVLQTFCVDFCTLCTVLLSAFNVFASSVLLLHDAAQTAVMPQ